MKLSICMAVIKKGEHLWTGQGPMNLSGPLMLQISPDLVTGFSVRIAVPEDVLLENKVRGSRSLPAPS
jgi:hypothetical protein